LIAERLAAAGGHYYRGIMPFEEAVDYALLQRTEAIVAPVSPQGSVEIEVHFTSR
jgi:hypothetical protein